MEAIAAELSWSFLYLSGVGEGQMFVEHGDGEAEIEVFES